MEGMRGRKKKLRLSCRRAQVAPLCGDMRLCACWEGALLMGPGMPPSTALPQFPERGHPLVGRLPLALVPARMARPRPLPTNQQRPQGGGLARCSPPP